MTAITLTERQWADLRGLFEAMDSAWNMTDDGRDAGEWTVQERYDRLAQASFAGMNLHLLIDEIEASQ